MKSDSNIPDSKDAPFKISASTVKEKDAPGLYWDCGLPGFGLRVRPGAKVYVQRYYCRRHAKDHWITIGAHGRQWKLDPITGVMRTLTPEIARGEAARVLSLVADGRCPAEERDQAKRITAAGGDTFGGLAERFLEREQMAESTRRQWKWLLKHLAGKLSPPFVERAPATITRRDVAELLEVAKRPRDTRKLIVWVFHRAIDKGLIDNDPTVRVRTGKDVKRDRVLQHHELRAVWQRVTRPEASLYELGVQLALLTGVRRGEVFNAKRDERDREAKVWRIPGSRAKNSQPHDVPLTDLTIKLWDTIEARGASCPSAKDGWLLPSDDGPFTPRNDLWRMMLLGAGVISQEEDDERRVKRRRLKDENAARRPWMRLPFCFHDLRRTVRDMMTRELGVQVAVAEAVIGHAAPAIVATYAPSGMLKECRKALDRWERKLLAIAAANPGDKVVHGAFGA